MKVILSHIVITSSPGLHGFKMFLYFQNYFCIIFHVAYRRILKIILCSEQDKL